MRTQNITPYWRLITLSATLLIAVATLTTLFYIHSKPAEAAPPVQSLGCPYNHSLIIHFYSNTNTGTVKATVGEIKRYSGVTNTITRSKTMTSVGWKSFYYAAHVDWKYYTGILQPSNGASISKVSYGC